MSVRCFVRLVLYNREKPKTGDNLYFWKQIKLVSGSRHLSFKHLSSTLKDVDTKHNKSFVSWRGRFLLGLYVFLNKRSPTMTSFFQCESTAVYWRSLFLCRTAAFIGCQVSDAPGTRKKEKEEEEEVKNNNLTTTAKVTDNKNDELSGKMAHDL